jgi:hypothetical protein
MFTFNARGIIDGLSVMLQAGKSQIRVPMRSLNFFFNLPNSFSRTMCLDFIQPLTEISTRRSLSVATRKADNLTAICEPFI